MGLTWGPPWIHADYEKVIEDSLKSMVIARHGKNVEYAYCLHISRMLI